MASPQEVVGEMAAQQGVGGWAGDQEVEVGWVQGPVGLGAGHHTRLQQQFGCSMQQFGG